MKEIFVRKRRDRRDTYAEAEVELIRKWQCEEDKYMAGNVCIKFLKCPYQKQLHL